jgi:uncharacterized protein
LEAIRFETEDGLNLEGELRRPEGSARGTAVICHPHPKEGGSKDHPLLWAIRKELAARGFTVLAFNFRGVMGSEGSYEGGRGETNDVRAAVSRVREESNAPTFVVGWSFGAHAALREALDDQRVEAMALLGFPLSESSFDLPPLPEPEWLRALDRPVLFVVGQADPFCPLPDLKSLARRLPNARIEVIPNTDHFFWKLEREAARFVGEFAEEATPEA